MDGLGRRAAKIISLVLLQSTQILYLLFILNHPEELVVLVYYPGLLFILGIWELLSARNDIKALATLASG